MGEFLDGINWVFGLILGALGFALSAISQRRIEKKDIKADVEEFKEYKMKADKALSICDTQEKRIEEVENRIKATEDLTNRVVNLIEHVVFQRTIEMPLAIEKVDAMQLLLELHKEENSKVKDAYESMLRIRKELQMKQQEINVGL